MNDTQRYLDPTNDVAFKKVFSDKDRLKDFLNAILRLEEGKRIKELYFIPAGEVPDLGQGKRSLFDLKCQDEMGTWFVIEMQSRREPNYLKRIQFYGSRAYTAQLTSGQAYNFLLPVVVVSVLKKSILPPHIEVISYHRTLEEKTNEQHLCDLSYVFVELGKFTKKAHELETFEDEWLYFLKSAEEIKSPPHTIKDHWVKQAYETIERFNWSELEFDAYIRASLILDGEEAAKQEAREEGAQSKAMDIAKSLLANGLSEELIMETTGLSSEALNALKD